MKFKCSRITTSFDVITIADRGATGVNADSPHHGPITVPTHEQVLLRLSRDSREYIRLSIDQYIWDHYGRYGIDYPPEQYSEYQSEASDELDKLLFRLLRRNRTQASDREVQARRPLTIVLDYSFATKADRDNVKETVEREGGRLVLVYFAISENRQTIRERVMGRKLERDVESGSCDRDNAFEVTDEVLDTYFATFQVPRGEGEIVIHWIQGTLITIDTTLIIYMRQKIIKEAPARDLSRFRPRE